MYRAIVLIAAIGTIPTAAIAQRPPLADLDSYIEAAIREWEVPGLAISIVKNDSVVLAKGYGIRALGGSDLVDENTLFAIGSCSKPFGSASMALLVQDGKLGWDDRVRRYLPWLELWDPWVTNEVRIRDLLAHRVGTAYTIENRLRLISTDYRDVVRRSRYLQPIAPFRDQYVYSNTMFIIAGEVITEVSGARSWNDFVRERIWVPLGMTGTNADIRIARSTTNKAMPHATIDGKLQPYEWEYADSLGSPSGGINSTARDMAQWLRFQLAGGKIAGRELLRTDLLSETHTPHSPAPAPERRTTSPMITGEADAKFIAYGLGWLIQDYRGRKMVHHSGGASGFVCQSGLLLEEKLGVYVGSSSSGLPEALMYRVFDAYLGEPRKDWSAIKLADAKRAEEAARRTADQLESSRVRGTRPSRTLGAYAGAFDDSGAYGRATVAAENGVLTFRIGRISGTLEHWHYDTFRVPPFTWHRSGDPLDPNRRYRTFGGMPPAGSNTFVTFVIGSSGKVSEMKVEDLAAFKRVPQ